jgi:hypothetical protein
VRASSWLQVEPLINLRNHLIELLANGRIEITIAGQYQARAFVQAVEPAIRLELRHCIQDIECQLRGLGVEID